MEYKEYTQSLLIQAMEAVINHQADPKFCPSLFKEFNNSQQYNKVLKVPIISHKVTKRNNILV